MPLQFDGIDDAVIATLRNLNKGKMSDLASKYQKYVAFTVLMRGAYVHSTEEYGEQWNAIMDDNGSARNVGLLATDDISMPDVLANAKADLRHQTANWAYDMREKTFNEGNLAARILNLVETRAIACKLSVAERFEKNMWATPNASDTVSPWGIPYYLVSGGGSTGFEGGAPSGFDTVANINPTTYPKWKNYTDRYVDVTYTDLVTKLETAIDKTQWICPVDINDYNTGDAKGIYTTHTVVQGLRKIMRSNNDNHGFELAYGGGKVIIRGTPVTWVPFFDDNIALTNPLYGVDWGDMKVMIKKNWFMRQDGPHPIPGQHTGRVVHVDSSTQVKCTNRRTQFVVDQA